MATLTPLITKPGFLSLEFVKRKRSPYVPPLRLYLFVSFIYFLLASVIANFTPPSEIAINNPDTEDAAPNVLNMEGDSNVFNRKLDSLLSLNMDSVPDDDYMEARLG